MDAFFGSLPETLKAAATSGLGAFALLALIVGFIAWVFFRDAPIRWRFAAFVMLFVGVAGFAAALFVNTPSVIQRADAATPARPAPLRACRLPANGVDHYRQESRLPIESGWRDGGSNPDEWCSGKVTEQQRRYPDRAVSYEHPTERSRERLLRHFEYLYACTIVERWDPLYVLAENADCP